MRNVLKVIPMLLITALLVLFWIDDFAGVMVAALFFWLFIPALIAAVYFMIKSRRLSNVAQKILFGIGVFNLLFQLKRVSHIYALLSVELNSPSTIYSIAESLSTHFQNIVELFSHL